MKNINILIIDKISGSLSKVENERLEKWINASPQNVKYFNKVTHIITNKHISKEFNSRKALKSFKRKHSINKYIRTNSLLKYVAMFIFITSLATFGYSRFYNYTIPVEEYVVVKVPKAVKKVIFLSDGTKVRLNSGTVIKYPKTFGTKSRNVIIDGEAFFEVVHNKNKPFIVSSEYVDVVVLGTKFNISAYKNRKLVSTSLFEGSVKVVLKDGSQSVKIQPNQIIYYNIASDKIIISDVNVNKEVSWLRDVLKFKNENLANIIRKIELWYNVEILVSNINTENLLFTGTFENKNINEVMKIMTEISDSQCKIDKRKIEMYK